MLRDLRTPRHHRTSVTTHWLFPTDNTLTHTLSSSSGVFLPCCEFPSTIFNHLPCAYHTPPPRPAALPLCNAYLSYPTTHNDFFATLPSLRSRVFVFFRGSIAKTVDDRTIRRVVRQRHRGPNLSETLYSNEIILYYSIGITR